MNDFEILRKKYQDLIGYALFKDYGDLPKAERVGNSVVFPVCGLFRMNPMVITAIPEPFIGTASAEIQLFTVPERLEEVVGTLNKKAAEVNGTAFYVEEDGKRYAVTYACQTASVGDKIDLAAMHGAGFIVRQVITYSIIEGGLPSSDVRLKINGHNVPLINLTETKVHTPIVFPDEHAQAVTASEMGAFGIDFNTPTLTGTEVGQMFADHMLTADSNRAVCVELQRGEKTDLRIMAITKVAESAAAPQNAGMGVSLADISDIAATFDGFWIYEETEAPVVEARRFQGESVVFWGDGTAEKNPKGFHFYADKKTSHEIRYFLYGLENTVLANVGDSIDKRILYATEDIIATAYPAEHVLMKTDKGERIFTSGTHICMDAYDEEGDLMMYIIDELINSDGGVGAYGIPKGKRIAFPAGGTLTVTTSKVRFKRTDLDEYHY